MHEKARKYEGMRRTYWYAGLAERSQAKTEDAAQRNRWTFYEVVKFVISVHALRRSLKPFCRFDEGIIIVMLRIKIMKHALMISQKVFNWTTQ